MNQRRCEIIGFPMQDGAGRRGCAMGPEALRTAELIETLQALGVSVSDLGDLQPPPAMSVPAHPNAALKNLGAVCAWTAAIQERAAEIAGRATPIFLGGDHTIAAGTISGVAAAAAAESRPLFVLWLDAHSDFHSLSSTQSGNLHGAPIAYVTGDASFDGYFPPLNHPVPFENICMIGLRSVDQEEREALARTEMRVYDMRYLDEFGVARPLREFLETVRAAEGWLHVSLDVDFLDPTIAPGVGTTVPGGATHREAHLIMEMVHESGLARSLDLVELNPFLDIQGRSALLMADLAASLFGRRITNL